MDARVSARISGVQFDATGDARTLSLDAGQRRGHGAASNPIGVHDHGFNNVSTYGNLWRFMIERRIADSSGNGGSTNSRSSSAGRCKPPGGNDDRRHRLHLFVQWPPVAVRRHDPILPLAGLAHQLGHVLIGERDERINLLAATCRACHQHGPLQHLVRRKPRCVRRSRPHGP